MIVNTGCRSPLFLTDIPSIFIIIWIYEPYLFWPCFLPFGCGISRLAQAKPFVLLSFFFERDTKTKRSRSGWSETTVRYIQCLANFSKWLHNRHKWTANTVNIFSPLLFFWLSNYWHLGSHNRIIFYHIMTHEMLPLPVTSFFFFVLVLINALRFVFSFSFCVSSHPSHFMHR